METGNNIANGWLAFAGVVAGGALTKLIDRYFALHERKAKAEDERRKELSSEETGFRSELRQQILDVRTELQETRAHVGDLQVMVDEWREKYYQHVAENLSLNSRYGTLQLEYQTLQKSNNELEVKYDQLKISFDDLLKKVQAAGVQI